MWNVAGEPCVCLYSGAVTVGVCHTTMFSVVYIMTQAERLRQKELQRRRNNNKKNNSTTGQCSFVSSFKNQKLSTQTWESEIVDNFWRPEIFARTCQYCLKKKKNLYMYIFCNSVIGRLIICENVCVCWWIIHVGWIFLYIRFTFKYF